jgi:pimeloyl-ACP methyl ester carboxylesterase
LIATLCLLLGPAGASAAEGERVPRLVDEACDIEIVDATVAARLRCARLVVHRDPQRPEDGTFELAVVVKRSAEPKPGATPVLFLHGGPGGGMTRHLGRSPSDFAPGHDLVGFDMRGGGRSTPRVCDAAGSQVMATFLHPDGLDAGIRERRLIIEACRVEWEAAGLRGEHFGTARTVADAEALRVALGIGRWRLFGESYGTTVAAHYLATHPESLEAAVLDSLYPKDAEVLSGPEMQGRMMERIGAHCREDAACAARWPDFGRDRLDATVAALDAAPLAVGRGDRARLLDGVGLRAMLTVAAGDEAGVRSLPFLIDAAARRDTALLEGPLSLIGQGGSEGGVNLVGTLATDCRDRARHHHTTDLSDPMGLLLGVPGDVCRDWAKPAEAPRWPADVRVPVLLLAGGYDSFQPDPTPVLAAMGASARLVEIPHAAHGARGAGPCAREVVGRFLAAPAEPLDTGCIAEMVVPEFLLHATPSRGLRQWLPTLMLDRPPPVADLIAIAAALLALLVAIVGLWRGRGGRGGARPRRWLVLPALAGITAVAAPAIMLANHDPMASAALVYGLPGGWGWLPWLGLLPASVGALALWLGGAWPPRIAGIAAILVAVAMAVGGWSVFG